MIVVYVSGVSLSHLPLCRPPANCGSIRQHRVETPRHSHPQVHGFDIILWHRNPVRLSEISYSTEEESSPVNPSFRLLITSTALFYMYQCTLSFRPSNFPVLKYLSVYGFIPSAARCPSSLGVGLRFGSSLRQSSTNFVNFEE